MTPADLPPGDPPGPLAEHAPFMMWRAGVDGRCDYFNAAWLAFTGLTLGEQVARGWADGLHPDDAPRCQKAFRENVSARTPFDLEYRRRSADGGYHLVRERAAPLPDADAEGTIAGFVGGARDLEEERKIDRAKASFFSATAHDLRAKLNAAKSTVEGLSRAAQRGKQVKPEQLAHLLGQIDHLEATVRELGDAARLEEGVALMLSLAKVDMAAVARDAVESVSARLGKGHTIAVEPAPLVMPVMGDRRRLEQAVLNLLDNALRYSPQGGKIAVALTSSGVEHRVAVTDPGIGIPPDELRSLPRRFHRGSNAVERFPGAGLGLAVTKEIVERHGGRLELRSILGRGTTATLVLPGVKDG
jgi:PAS domain S-box-containing protein